MLTGWIAFISACQAKYKNLAIATGHAAIGLSLAPATGKLIADAFNGEKAPFDTGLFAVGRYQIKSESESVKSFYCLINSAYNS